MPQPQKTYRVKALKMFKAPTGGPLPVMINPGDVVEVDAYMAGMLLQTKKAELTEEKPHIDPNYKAPERAPSAADPIALLTAAVASLTKIVQELAGGRQQKLGH